MIPLFRLAPLFLGALLLFVGCEEDSSTIKSVDVIHELDALSVAEGSMATSTVMLGSNPGSSATVYLTSDDTSAVGFSTDGGATVTESAVLVFDSTNWEDAQEVSVVGLLDGVADGDQVVNVGASLSETEPGIALAELTVSDLSGVQLSVAAPGADSPWEECFSELYNVAGTTISSILSACSGTYLMMACRPVGDASLSFAAYADRSDVTATTPSSPATNTPTHLANNVKWYNSGFSWGFAGAADQVDLNSCDGGTGGTRMSLCTGSGDLEEGHRCGDNTGLTGGPGGSWERVLFHAN